MFAAAWAERWIANGGAVMVGAEGHVSLIARVSADDVPGYVEPPPEWTEEQRLSRRSVDDWMLCGRTHELVDLLEVVPHGRDAVKAHVIAYPSMAYRDGRRELS